MLPSNQEIDQIAKGIQNIKSMEWKSSLAEFEQRTFDQFLEKIMEALKNDEALSHEFPIEGQFGFSEWANFSKRPLLTRSFDSVADTETDSDTDSDTDTSRKPVITSPIAGGGMQRPEWLQEKYDAIRDPYVRNRRGDQTIVPIVADERREPVYAIEFKPPHRLTIPILVAGLHPTDVTYALMYHEGNTFEFYATRLVAALVTQIFSYMVDRGVRYGYIYTGEAFVFLHIPMEDPTTVQYFLCVPNQDVHSDDESRLHRTAIGQVLAFALQALTAERPSQKWYDTACNRLETWEFEYLDIWRDIRDMIPRDSSLVPIYRPSPWEINNTGSHSGAPCPTNRSSAPFCTIDCIHGIVERGLLDEKCPNWKLHGSDGKHSIGPKEFKHRLQNQLAQDGDVGFETLHIKGRTGYMIKATLISHGYTVIIKATTRNQRFPIRVEEANYRHLKEIQGQTIPVCLGIFTSQFPYWYNGKPMQQMMILSWSGVRPQLNDENRAFFDKERERALNVLSSRGMEHCDTEWRNMLLYEMGKRLIVVDLEYVDWR